MENAEFIVDSGEEEALFERSGAAGLPSGNVDEYRFLRGLVQGMRCGILTVARDGRLLMMNEPARKILELREKPEGGAPVEEALSSHPQLAQILRESFGMSSLPNRAEIDLHCGSDRVKTIGFTLSMVQDQAGKLAGAAVFFKDLTHVEHKEEGERLRDRLAALGQMSANLAHEIRNPLASIEVTCSLLKRRIGEDDDGRDLLDKIVAEVRRLNRTITSSLEYVKPLSLSCTLQPLPPVLEEALQVAQGRRGTPGIRIERRFDETVPPFMMDRAQLRQVFENLCLNAMESMKDEGTLKVETFLREAPAPVTTLYLPGESGKVKPGRDFEYYVVVRISDTGPGIRAEHRDKLFYPFFTTKKQGSGVGLSMAKKIVDSHRGLMDVESTPGDGAAFTVSLPMVVDDPEEIAS